MHLLGGLEVGDEALQLHAQALELRAVLFLQHLGSRANRSSLLLLGQRREVHRDRAGAAGLRRRLRWRAGRLARLRDQVLQRLQAALQQGHLHVLQHALPQDVRTRVAERPQLGAHVAHPLLDPEQLVPLLLGLSAEALQREVFGTLHLVALLGARLVALELRLQLLGAVRERALLLAELLDLGLELGQQHAPGAAGLLLEGLLQHLHLGVQVAEPARELVRAGLRGLVLAPPLALELPHIFHAHGGAELRVMACDSLAELCLDVPLLVTEVRLLLVKASHLGAQRLHHRAGARQLLLLLPELVLAPLQARPCLPSFGLSPLNLVAEGCHVAATVRLQGVDLVEPPVDSGHAAPGGLQPREVEAGGTLARGLRVH
mmetsp:Transcript_116019/g.374748  ORF Transcript_116019/g.374748 Transcript_116019/m.374748 type:complete len:375 (-) Transcript_116019:2076-3200(-)